MTVIELIQKLSHFDSNYEVGGSGHFGELLEIEDVYLKDVRGHKINGKQIDPFVIIRIEWAGNEPD